MIISRYSIILQLASLLFVNLSLTKENLTGNRFAKANDVVGYDFHEEKSQKENLAGVAKDFCPNQKTFLEQTISSITENLYWYEKLAFYAIEAYSSFHQWLFDPMNLKEYIGVLTELCDMKSSKILAQYANLMYDQITRFDIQMPTPDNDKETLPKKRNGKMCTSLIFKSKLRNSIGFGSNMDLPIEDLSKLMYQKNYYKNNKLIYQSLSVFGSDGSIRAHSLQGNYFASLNSRVFKDKNDSILKYLFEISFRNVMNPSQLIEQISNKAKSMEEAIQLYSSTETTSPAYFTIGGISNKNDANNGCIITRGLTSVKDTTCLDEKTWFLTITNYDRDVPDPADDPRRSVIEQRIKNIGESVIETDRIYEILQMEPNFSHANPKIDEDYTLATTIGEISQVDKTSEFWSVWWDFGDSQKVKFDYSKYKRNILLRKINIAKNELNYVKIFKDEGGRVKGGQHYWSETLIDLPDHKSVKCSYEVKSLSNNAEFIGAFSLNKAKWGTKNVDALTWYAAPHRKDFTFRTKMFGEFPPSHPVKNKRLAKDVWHLVEVELSKHYASYKVNGEVFAYLDKNEGYWPISGYFGFAGYNSDWEWRDFKLWL